MTETTGDDNIWLNSPNNVAPLVFVILFMGAGCWHWWQAHYYKSWKMTAALPSGALLYVAGLATREAGSFHPENKGLYIASRVLTLDATAVCAAANYFILGRTLYYIPWASSVNPRRTTQIFIFLDWLIAILVTPGLVKVYDDDAGERRVGTILVELSQVMQGVLYVGYIAILAIWDRRTMKPNAQKRLPRRYVSALYACAMLIIVRCVYRCVEYAEAGIVRHEAYFYAPDALPILAMVLLLSLQHPGKFFSQDSSMYVQTDGVTELVGPGWSDERRWYWVLLDPLGLADYFRADKNSLKFWDVPRDGMVEENGHRDKATSV